MKITLEVEHQLLLEQLEKVLMRFKIPYQTHLTASKTVSEEERQKRIQFFKNYKPVGNKGNYMPPEEEWYEQ